MKVSTVVCTSNERETILGRLERLWGAAPEGWQVEVVVVDNYSTDGTRDALRGLEAASLQVIYQRRRQSPGACWRSAITHLSGEYVWFDRTLSGDATVLAGLLAEVDDEAAAIYSAPPEKPGKRDGVTRLVNALFGGDLDDVLGASKLVRADVLKALNVWGDGISLEASITVALLRARLAIQQVPVAGHVPWQPTTSEWLAAVGAVLSARVDPSPVWKRGRRGTLSDT